MRKETERRHTELKLELVSWTESETKSKQESKAKGRSSEGRSSAGHQLRTSRWEDHRPSWEDHRPSWEAGAGADSPQLSQERTAHGASARLGSSCPRSAQLTAPQPGSGIRRARHPPSFPRGLLGGMLRGQTTPLCSLLLSFQGPRSQQAPE